MKRFARIVSRAGAIAVMAAAAVWPCAATAGDWGWDDDEDGGNRNGHWVVDAGMGLNTDGYEVDLGVSWWPVPGFGVKLALGVNGEIEEFGDWDWWDDSWGLWGDCYDYAVRLRLMPSIELRSPALLLWNEGSNALRIFANPGLSLSPGASGSRDAEWFNWQLRAGVELDFDAFVVRGGYGYSNFNLYSGDPVSHNGYSRDRDRHTHSGFITLGFRF